MATSESDDIKDAVNHGYAELISIAQVYIKHGKVKEAQEIISMVHSLRMHTAERTVDNAARDKAQNHKDSA